MDYAGHDHGRYRVTRTALATPDDPDGPDPRTSGALTNGVSMVMKSIPADAIIWTATGSGKTATAFALVEAKIWQPPASVKHPWYATVSERLADLAVSLAGRKRAVMDSEWRAHLSGETGKGLPADRQVREAVGFLLAAIRYRLQDLADLLWRPVDAVLASRELSNLVVVLATLAVTAVFIRQGGLYGLADNLGSAAVVWGAAFGLVHVGRQWRDVRPPERKPRRRRQ